MNNITKAWLVMAVFASIFTATVRADEVTEWNQTMLRAGTVAQTTPLRITRVAAIVQAAIFDAVNGIDRRYTPPLPTLGPHTRFRYPDYPAGLERRVRSRQSQSDLKLEQEDIDRKNG